QPKGGEETDRRYAGDLVTMYPRHNTGPTLIDVSPSKHPAVRIEEIPFLPIEGTARRYFQCRQMGFGSLIGQLEFRHGQSSLNHPINPCHLEDQSLLCRTARTGG